jgi:hypothetical protein
LICSVCGEVLAGTQSCVNGFFKLF